METTVTSQNTSHHIGRPVDPTALESMGKMAANLAESAGLSMTDAVVKTVERAKLNQEQVRRVTEFANIEAFNKKFAALSGTTRAVHIDGGPADPIMVVQSLNDAARPQEVVVDSLEYSMPPDLMKSASAGVFDFTPVRTRAGAVGEVCALQSKLSAAHDQLVQSVEAAKERLSEAFVELVEQVKSASAGGATPREIYEAWSKIDEDVAKVAYRKSAGAMNSSNVKVAGRYINPSSRVVTLFRDLVKEAKSAEAHGRALSEVETELGRVSAWLRVNGS